MTTIFSLTKPIETKAVTLSRKGQQILLNHGSGRLIGIVIIPTPNHNADTAQSLGISDIFGHPNAQVLAAKYCFTTLIHIMLA
jgi:hypothetical protein